MSLDLKSFIRDVPDFPRKGIVFKDITPLLLDPAAFRHTIDLMSAPHLGQGIAKVAGIESRGFIFAAGLAQRLEAGFVPIRKKGKLPYKTISQTYELEYGTDTIEVHEDAIRPDEKVLLVDDVLATGGTLAAGAALLEQLQADIIEIVTVIELEFLNGRERLQGRPYRTLIKF
ncbi:MAG: adenine phosphoribosyltransferase [Candidatus Sumerlaeia bacterium]